MIDRYSRTKFISKNLVNGIQENDLPFNDFDFSFFKRPRTTYMIREDDIQRPDLISYKNYGKVNYWWIIMKLNKIEDVWNDLEVGNTLQMPHINDINDFVRISARNDT